ncbi:VOC family protein [Oerskovia sp. M15]
MSALHPNLAVSDARAAIEFYRAAFGAEVDDVITAGDAIVHSDLRLPTASGFSTFTVAQEFPGAGSVAPDADGPTSVSFSLPVADTDASYARAVAAGRRVRPSPRTGSRIPAGRGALPVRAPLVLRHGRRLGHARRRPARERRVDERAADRLTVL